MTMDASAVSRYIQESFDGLDVVEAGGDTFFFYDPARTLDPSRRLPFATLVTRDAYDRVSDLDREGVFRLNLGVGRETYRAMFGPQPSSSGVMDTGHDFAALDRVMPHPVYAPMSWICVLNPGDETFATLRPLLAEAHAIAADRHAKQSAR